MERRPLAARADQPVEARSDGRYKRTIFVPNYPYIGEAAIRLGLSRMPPAATACRWTRPRPRGASTW